MLMAAPFSSSKEHFLIVQVGAKGFSALPLDFDEKRELSLGKAVVGDDFKKFLTDQAGSIFQKSWEGKYFFNSRRRLVVLAGDSLATTLPIPLDFKRSADRAGEPITVGEVEDWFARATAKIFSRCRAEAGQRLDVGDVDTVLVNQRVERIAIDGHSVAHPVGHVGEKVSFVIELTFARRELSDLLAPFFNAPGEFFFAEAPQARLAALARVRSFPINMIVASSEGAAASLFVFEEAEKGCPVAYREPFPWDATATVRATLTALGVSRSAAEELYERYLAGTVSEDAKKYFDAKSATNKERFFSAVDKANIHGPVYVDAPYPLPFALPHRRGKAILEEVPVAALFEKFGFSVPEDTKIDPGTALRYLAPFFELYFDNNRSELNDILRRKLHWLA